jgi:hypothetical protein
VLQVLDPGGFLAAAGTSLADQAQIAGQDGELEQRGVVPVVRPAHLDLARDRKADDRQEFLLRWIGWLLELHQRHRIDAGIGVAPVGLEALPVGVDRPAEEAVGERLLAGLGGLVPAVLVDPACSGPQF